MERSVARSSRPVASAVRSCPTAPRRRDLNSVGQSAVASGGLVLAATESAALVSAGYVRIGSVVEILGDVWEPRRRSDNSVRAQGAHGGVDGQRDDRLGRNNGSGYLNDGGRYNPAANSWTAVSTTGAPAARYAVTRRCGRAAR